MTLKIRIIRKWKFVKAYTLSRASMQRGVGAVASKLMMMMQLCSWSLIIRLIIIIIIIIITCYLSTPFLILQIHKGASRVIFTNFHNAYPLTRPHPHAVRRKVIIISNCRLVPHWREFLGVSWSWIRSDLSCKRAHRLARRALNQLSYQDRQLYTTQLLTTRASYYVELKYHTADSWRSVLYEVWCCMCDAWRMGVVIVFDCRVLTTYA